MLNGRSIVIHALAMAFMMTRPLPAQSVDFHQTELARGKQMLAENRYVDAATSLRIAAFGLLDRPPVLIDALANLFVAYHRGGRDDQARQTLERMVLVEERFNVWRSAALSPDVRTFVRERAAVILGPARADAVQLFAENAPVRAAPTAPRVNVSQLRGEERTAALEAAASSDPKNIVYPLMLISEAASRGDHRAVVRWGTTALEINPDDPDARLYRARGHVALGECEPALDDFDRAGLDVAAKAPGAAAEWFLCLVRLGRAEEARALALRLDDASRNRRDVAAAIARLAPVAPPAGAPQAAVQSPASPPRERSAAAAPPPSAPSADSAAALAAAREDVAAGRFAAAERRLYEAVQADRSNRALRLALLEAAVLAKDFSTGWAQVPLTSPYAEGEESSAFYAAVAAWESGRLDDAKRYLAQTRGRVRSRPWVDYYVTRIESGRR